MHPCPDCPKSFPSPYKLQRHYVIHTGQKPFTCAICGNAFTQSDHLRTHMQKVHHSRLPTDRLRRGGIATRNQQANCGKPAAGINTHGSSNYTVLPSMVSSSVASQLEWKRENVAHKTGNPPKNMPRVNDASVTWSCISNVDPIPREQVDSASADTSVRSASNGYTCKVCLESFTSSLHLWIHSTIHDKPKQFDRGREPDQAFSKQAYSKEHLQSQELSSGRSKTTLKHQCPACLKTFCSPSKLQRHFLNHTGQKPYSCTMCRKAFTQKVHLKSHLSTANTCSHSAHTERNMQSFCNSKQTSGLQLQSSLQQHPTSHPSPVNSSVELELQCKISVNAVQDLNKTEIKSDAVVKPQQSLNTRSQCWSVCQKSDEQERQHSTHKDLKPFQCMICNRSFQLEINLIRHHKIHRNQKELRSPSTVQNSNNVKMPDSEAIKPEPSHADPIDLNVIVKPENWSENCSDYNESLLQDSELITPAEQGRETCHATSEQQRINSLHQCHTCLKCFPSVSKLQRHMMTHTGQRPFGCEMCAKRFRQKTHLRVHSRTHLWSRYHKQRSLYINRPTSCIGGFNTRPAADVPVQEMLLHKKDFETHVGSDVVPVKHLDPTASMVIIQNDKRESDNKLLPRTSKKNEVVRMVSTVTEKRTQIAKSTQHPGNVQHKCFQCLKCFPSASKLQRHEMVHTGLKPFQCVSCGKAFRQAPHLKVHERLHCKRKPSKPVSQQGNMRKLKANSLQQLYPRISVRIPQQTKSVNTDSKLSNSDDAVSNGVSASLCTRREISITKVNSLFKTNCKGNVTFKNKKLHTCRICFKSFMFPYKLSRHMVTHSGIRPYKCTLCSRTFTQRGHLKIHENKCRQGNKVLHCIQAEMMNAKHLQDKCIENRSDCTNFNVDALREQLESHYTSVGHHSFTDGDASYCSEAIDTEWLAVPEVGLQEEDNESEKKQRDDCNQTTDHCNFSFPSELAFEIDKLVQNPNMAAPPLSHQYEGNAHNAEVPCQPKGVAAISNSNKLLSDELVSSVIENQMQPDDYWCEPLIVFECARCSVSFNSENNLKQHICSTNVSPKMTAQKHCCDICFKHFASPSKLKRHYLTHTGQRPFGCDICGKTFTQATHVRTHRLTH
ncbi:zinc finger protein 770-like [Sebastes umbrosus]|uniref:zinc finger protein 770-like n=1 Tax=Sebastes umbrosus TaxID=72105 RepID=UPI0018A09177|nr:zinc finger protein 770-like [Sebastes umbrosus]